MVCCLGDAVEALRLEHQILGKAVVEDSVAQPQHGLGRTLGAAQSPGETEARREVRLIADALWVSKRSP